MAADADDLHIIPTRAEQRLDGQVEVHHAEAGTAVVSPRQAKVMAKSGWVPTDAPHPDGPATASPEIPADESAPTPTNPED